MAEMNNLLVDHSEYYKKIYTLAPTSGRYGGHLISGIRFILSLKTK